MNTSFVAITYSTEKTISPDEFIQILKNSTLAERRPVDDYDRIQKMVDHADILVTAWHGEELVGVARCITDYAYCTYLSDLAVHKNYQRKGIGKELTRISRKLAGNDVNYFLVAAPAAKDYYKKIGFSSINRGWILKSGEKLS